VQSRLEYLQRLCVRKMYMYTYLNVCFWHKADIQDLNIFNDIILKQSQNFPVDTHQVKE